MNHSKRHKRHLQVGRKALWTPLLSLTRGVMLFSLLAVVMVMLKRMGYSNTSTTAATSMLVLTLVFRQWAVALISRWCPLKWWLVLSQGLFAVAMLMVSPPAVGQSDFVNWTWLVLAAVSAGIHDVAVSRYSMPWHNGQRLGHLMASLMSFLLAALLVMGLCLMIAGDLEVMERNLSDAWVRVLRLIGVFMAVVALLIAGGMKVERDLQLGGWTALRMWWMRPHQWMWAIFIVLFSMHEWMLWRGTLLFLIDPGSIGGLSFGPMEAGFAQGSVAVLAMMAGVIIGYQTVKKWGIRRCLWPMAVAATLPDVLLLYLSFRMPSDVWTVSMLLAMEGLALGFALAVFLVYVRCSVPGRQMAAHADACVSLLLLSAWLAGMMTGFMQDMLGYRRFFLIVVALAVLAVASLLLLRLAAGQQWHRRLMSVED